MALLRSAYRSEQAQRDTPAIQAAQPRQACLRVMQVRRTPHKRLGISPHRQ
jgi:hypothetical protein